MAEKITAWVVIMIIASFDTFYSFIFVHIALLSLVIHCNFFTLDAVSLCDLHSSASFNLFHTYLAYICHISLPYLFTDIFTHVHSYIYLLMCLAYLCICVYMCVSSYIFTFASLYVCAFMCLFHLCVHVGRDMFYVYLYHITHICHYYYSKFKITVYRVVLLYVWYMCISMVPFFMVCLLFLKFFLH